MRAAGYIQSARGAQSINACIGSLRAGNNLIVFPEGTRTPASGVIALKRGATNIAVRGACAVTPVVIRCHPSTLGKGDKWWQVPARLARFHIEVMDDIAIERFSGAGVTNAIAARRLTEHLQHYFTEEGQRHA